MMKAYILSVLGIVIIGVIIDIIIPSGSINKYIKSVYAIFVVAVLISPIINLINKNQGFNFQYEDFEINSSLLNYINSQKANSIENDIKNRLKNEGYDNIDIIINYSQENNEFKLISCLINLQNVVISSDKQHINKYEFIREVVKEITNLADEVIIFNE